MERKEGSWDNGNSPMFLPDIYSPINFQSKLFKKIRKPSDLKKAKEEEEKARKEKLKWERMKNFSLEGRKIQKKVKKDLPENFENLLHEIMTHVLLKKPCPDKMNHCISQYLEKQLLIRTAAKYDAEKYEEFYDQDFQDLISVPLPQSKTDKIPRGFDDLMNIAPSAGKGTPTLTDYLDEAAKSGGPSAIDVLLSQMATEEVDFPSPYNEECSHDHINLTDGST